jgi:hypothetical protein
MARNQAQAMTGMVQQQAQARTGLAQQNLDVSLGNINRRRSQLGEYFGGQKSLAQQQAEAQIAASRRNAEIGRTDLQGELAQFGTETQAKTIDQTEQAARAKVEVEQALRRNFAGRDALDSSFFAGAVAKGIGGISETEMKNKRALASALENATAQTNRALSKIDTDLRNKEEEISIRRDSYLSELQKAYDDGRISLDEAEQQAQMGFREFMTETELAQLEKLQQIQFNLQDQLYSYQKQGASLKDQMKAVDQELLDLGTDIRFSTPEGKQSMLKNYYISVYGEEPGYDPETGQVDPTRAQADISNLYRQYLDLGGQ